jgi:hypothetical protein
MNRHIATAALVASSMLFALTSHAQEGGNDEVTLKNGGSIRGTVVASEPGTSVKIIEMGQKEVRVIPWSQVSDVERGKYAPKAPAQPGPAGPGYGAAPPPPAPIEPKLGSPGIVRLHVESPEPAQIIEHVGTSVGAAGAYTVVVHQLRPVCSAPCDRVVDGSGGQEFGVTGRFPVKTFTLTPYSGDVTLRVKPGSTGLRLGGWFVTPLAGATLIGGVSFLAVGGSSTFRNAGIGMVVGGAVALAGGIAMLATSGTKVKLEQEGSARTGKIKPRYWMGEF